MALPYVHSQLVWSAQAVSATKELDSEFQNAETVVVEVTTTGFTGTLAIQGKVHEISDYSNIPYIRQDQATLQTPAVTTLTFSADTGIYRYVPVGWWRKLQLVMSRSAGTITVAVVGSSNAQLFPRIIQT